MASGGIPILDKSLEVCTRLRFNTGLYAKRTWKGKHPRPRTLLPVHTALAHGSQWHEGVLAGLLREMRGQVRVQSITHTMML